MTRYAFFLLLMTTMLSFPAQAQGRKVVTINPDGSVTISDPQGGEAQTLPAPKSSLRRQPPFADAVPREPAPAPIDAEKPETAPVPEQTRQKPAAPKKPAPPKKKPAPEKPVSAKPVTEKPLREKILTPDAPDVAPPVRETVRKPIVETPPLPDVPEDLLAIPDDAPTAKPELEGIVRGEPAAPDSMGRADPSYTPTPRQQKGAITPDDAKRIALDIGPPARAVDVYPADYSGRKVFQVIFHTEQGERYVLVDRKTGEIVND